MELKVLLEPPRLSAQVLNADFALSLLLFSSPFQTQERLELAKTDQFIIAMAGEQVKESKNIL